MGSSKYARGRVAVFFCAMAAIWLISGCGKNRSSAPISNIGDESYNSLDKQRQLDISQQENIIYNRIYNNIHKGSYFSTTYKVKQGDTLFYIAWITGNNYQILAKKNTLSEPYSLKVGQILQVGKEAMPIFNKVSMVRGEGNLFPSNDKHTNSSVMVDLGSTSNIDSTKSRVTVNKKNNHFKNSNKQKKNIDNVIITTAPVITSRMAGGVKEITDWCWPTEGKIIDNFSVEEGGNKGVDISGFRGQPILAISSGKVVYAGNALRGYGNLIIIKHNDDYLNAYAHNDKLLVGEQQEVKAGQKIATMGSTGTNITKLHFEIRYKGKCVNPLLYLPKR
ncbi:MAG: murein hydrolase activator NlpD [Sodalis sp. (in: enterobacteria)]